MIPKQKSVNSSWLIHWHCSDKIWRFPTSRAEGNGSAHHWQVTIAAKTYAPHCLIIENAIWFRASNAGAWNGYKLWHTAVWVIYAWVKYKPVKKNFMRKLNLNVTGLSNCHLKLNHFFFLSFLHFSNFQVAKSSWCIQNLSTDHSYQVSGRQAIHNGEIRVCDLSVEEQILERNKGALAHASCCHASFTASSITVAGEHHQRTVWT